MAGKFLKLGYSFWQEVRCRYGIPQGGGIPTIYGRPVPGRMSSAMGIWSGEQPLPYIQHPISTAPLSWPLESSQ